MKETKTQRNKKKVGVFFYPWLLLILLIINTPHNLLAQKGPGGVGSTDGTSSLELWMMADHDTAVHYDQNNNITGVSDLSGHNHHINKIYSYPKYRTNRINGRPAFEFDGQNDILVIEGFDVSPSKKPNLSIFVVFNSDEDQFDNTQTARNDSIRAKLYGNDNHGWDRSAGFEERGHPSVSRGGGNWRYYRGQEYCDSTGQACTPRPMYNITKDSFYVFSSFHFETELRYYGYMNGQQVAYDSVNHNDGTPNFCIGALSDNSENTHNTYAKQQWWDGDIAEFIMFTRKLNSAERRAVENYLSAKYNIPMINPDLNDYYAGNNDYNHLVSAIGMEVDGATLNSNSKGFIIESDTTTGSFLQDARDYIFTGKDNSFHGITTNDLPSGYSNGKRWSDVWYVDVTDAGSAGGAIDLYLDYSQVGSINEPKVDSNYRLIYRSGTTGNFSELDVQPLIINDSLKFTFDVGSGVDEINDGYYTLASKNTSVSPLPVGLNHFRGHLLDQSVVLEWSTAHELNNSHFEIERSRDGINWNSIGQVTGAGNSNKLLEYHFVDENVVTGVNYYRLRQVDFDNSFEYSQVVVVEADKNASIVPSVFPNPFDRQLYISFNTPLKSELRWRLISIHGKIQESGRMNKPGKSSAIAVGDDLKPGIYYLQLQLVGEVQTLKVIRR